MFVTVIATLRENGYSMMDGLAFAYLALCVSGSNLATRANRAIYSQPVYATGRHLLLVVQAASNY